jgi:hypothetical protein
MDFFSGGMLSLDVFQRGSVSIPKWVWIGSDGLITVNLKLIAVNFKFGKFFYINSVLSMTIKELITQASKQCELFANPLRSFIAAFIAVKEEVTWSELKGGIEKWSGPVNPNTLSFHLGQLIDAGFITKIDIKGQPRYKIIEGKLPEIKKLSGTEVFEALKGDD